MVSVLHSLAVLLVFTVLWNLAPAKEICHLPAETGECKAYARKWFFNMKSMECEKFTYGGCKGNKNRFDTKEECLKKCRCYLSKDKGPCKGKIPRWFYNKKLKECKKFFYGGCKGNGNNFKTLKKCQKVCKDKKN